MDIDLFCLFSVDALPAVGSGAAVVAFCCLHHSSTCSQTGLPIYLASLVTAGTLDAAVVAGTSPFAGSMAAAEDNMSVSGHTPVHNDTASGVVPSVVGVGVLRRPLS